MAKRYSELIQIESFEDRLRYLLLGGAVGADTFGFDRYLNQMFYRDAEWARIRRQVILRDNGLDLAHPDRPIAGPIFVHHIEPITRDDVLRHAASLLDPDNLVCCSKQTHDRIHYGAAEDVTPPFVERTPFDTCPWKEIKT